LEKEVVYHCSKEKKNGICGLEEKEFPLGGKEKDYMFRNNYVVFRKKGKVGKKEYS